MLLNIWNYLLYWPLINALAFLISIIPFGDVGFAVIILTILVKIILFPLSKKSIQNQAVMNILSPELEKIKKNSQNKEEQARLTFEIYKKYKVNPFSGCLLMLIQTPILIALYYVFYKGIDLNKDILYSFIHLPENINMIFLGFIDISKKSILLAFLAGISQYFQAYFMPKADTASMSPGSFQESFTKSMQTNIKYIFPIIIFIILGTDLFGFSLSGAVALYFITSNIFSIGQQIYLNKKNVTNMSFVK